MRLKVSAALEVQKDQALAHRSTAALRSEARTDGEYICANHAPSLNQSQAGRTQGKDPIHRPLCTSFVKQSLVPFIASTSQLDNALQ